ncbi:MAG: tRNA-dihydrouridine synthase [Sporosarcina sp.]
MYVLALKGEHVAVREMRKHASWYMKGIRGNAKIRNLINTMETADELTSLMNGFADERMQREQAGVGVSAV